MRHIDDHSSHSPAVHTFPATMWGELTNNAGLLIDEIGRDHLKIRAIGSFDAAAVPRVASRLNQLVASAGHLRIDFSSVAEIDPAIASLVRQAATTVEAAGGTLDVVGLNDSFYETGPTTVVSSDSDTTQPHLDAAS